MSFKEISFLANKRIPFLFFSDFKAKKVEVYPLDLLAKKDIEFAICKDYRYKKHNHLLEKKSLSFASYAEKFNQIIEKIKNGESYILNLTQPTEVVTPLSLKEIFDSANAHYKLRVRDEFVCFSPETFIQIYNNEIHTFPMKGTIDASLPDAKERILADKKEMAEHVMIVDLLRNDLSMVAKKVHLKKFRYVKKIHAGQKELLQVSSHISGLLESSWRKQLGEILYTLLPAGSISGAPKRSTVDIIERVEGYDRGFFSGVFGFFDGENFDSAVMIRFIEKKKNGYLYKSGGGITLDSCVYMEYKELQEKVYLP